MKLLYDGRQYRRVGESGSRAKLTDHDVDLIRELAEPQGRRAGEAEAVFEARVKRYMARLGETLTEHQRQQLMQRGLSYSELSAKFEAPKSTIRNIVRCITRAARAERVKLVPISEG